MSESDNRTVLKLKIFDIENAWDMSQFDFSGVEEGMRPFINLTNGELVWPEGLEESEAAWDDPNLAAFPDSFDMSGEDYRTMERFVQSLDEGATRNALINAISGKGAFRRFKDIVIGGSDIELLHDWNHFEQMETRRAIEEWLESIGIEPVWDEDIYQQRERKSKRPDLLKAVYEFVTEVAGTRGVEQIALIGSLATEKATPTDVDLLVTVNDKISYKKLAASKRRLQGKTMATGDSCGADVFVCDTNQNYLGRMCYWKECAPGLRRACEAQNCGTHLYDDFQNLRLDPKVIASPPLVLWPKVNAVARLPDDVSELLIKPLDSKIS